MLLPELRKALNLTPQQVAAELGISTATLWRHERGRTPLNGLLLRGYGSYYEVPWTEIEQAKP